MLGQTQASYAVPFLAVTACTVALIVLVLSTRLPAGSGAFWAFFALAVSLLGLAACMVGFAVLKRPELLRSEQAFIVQQAMDTFGNDEIGDLAGKRVERTVGKYLGSRTENLEGPDLRKRSLPEDDTDDEANDD